MQVPASFIGGHFRFFDSVLGGKHIVLAAAICALLTGCVTTSSTSSNRPSHFNPTPVANVVGSDLDAARIDQLRDLLHRARIAMEAANLAHEGGDDDEALEQYTLMLELLSEASLDPTVFYNLRTEFESILATSTEHAMLQENDPTAPWRRQAAFPQSVEGLQFPNPLPERVLAEIEEILSLYPSNFERGLARAGQFQPYIEQKFSDAGLPPDLVWLAMVESQFSPKIVSRAGAGGMWQFMRSTGRRYGLESDEYVDDRFDWKKSTDAAIGYLKDLYAMFDGEWPLAISAYNMGEGGLERAIAANGGDRDLWALLDQPPAADRIKLETKKFYPKLLASAIVGKNPQKYGFNPQVLPPDDTVVLPVSGAYQLRNIESAAEILPGELVRLNPHLLREMTHPTRQVSLYVPRTKQSEVESALKTIPKLRTDMHVVKRGETPSGIADKYGVSTDALMKTNNIRSARSLQVGQRLVIPGSFSAAAEPPASANQATTVASAASAERSVYKVRSGDSLSRIASKYKVSTRELQSWNNLGARTKIRVGEQLYVSRPNTETVPAEPVASPDEEPAQIAATPAPEPDEPPAPAEIIHTVVKGDTTGLIAEKYGVRLSELLQWNNLTMRSVIRIGQQLKIYSSSAPAAPEVITHTVNRGENPTTIAEKYGVSLEKLCAANGWSKAPTIYVGQKIAITR